jgi:drug/metabolite transporter (DMT)-like permease
VTWRCVCVMSGAAAGRSQIVGNKEDEDPAPTPTGEKDALVVKTAEPTGTQASPPWLKLVILVCVTLQNTAYALVRRYSRHTMHETYSTSSVLLAMEAAKLLLSAERLVNCGLPSDVPDGTAISKYCFLIRTSHKMAVPAVIYLIMNILGFVALAHIDAATFSIVAQLKVFSTAMFSVTVLGRSLPWRKWRALTTLTLGTPNAHALLQSEV